MHEEPKMSRSRLAALVLVLAATPGLAQIAVDPSKPVFGISDSSVVEGNSGTTPMVFTIGVSVHSGTVSVSWATADGTAKAPDDYTAAAGTVTFAQDEYLKQISVDVVGDTLQEGNESFTVVLSSPSAGSLYRATGTGVIVDDDGAPASAVRGDANSNGTVDIADLFYLANYLFGGGPAPASICNGDANDDGVVDVRDFFFLIGYLFAGGPAPSPAGC
jgi:hypothetical protein